MNDNLNGVTKPRSRRDVPGIMPNRPSQRCASVRQTVDVIGFLSAPSGISFRARRHVCFTTCRNGRTGARTYRTHARTHPHVSHETRGAVVPSRPITDRRKREFPIRIAHVCWGSRFAPRRLKLRNSLRLWAPYDFFQGGGRV